MFIADQMPNITELAPEYRRECRKESVRFMRFYADFYLWLLFSL